MNNLIIDTSVFVSALGKPDDFTQSSQDFFEKLPREGTGRHPPREISIILPTLVVAETVVTIGKQNVAAVEDIYKRLSRFSWVLLDEQFLLRMLPLIQPINIRTSDFIIATTAKLHHATLITWDTRLLGVNGILCPIMTPGDYLAEE